MIRKTLCAMRNAPLLLALAMLAVTSARAQVYTDAELEDLVAPVALYPDDVLGIILPASTFPLDVVEAARFLDDLEDEPGLEPEESWDDTIVALLNYPEVVDMMNEDLDWTWALGEAVLTDQEAVLAAAQRFRERAYAAGNLQSDDRQIVSRDAETIEIRPADPEIIYIPYYEPREVIVYQPRPVIHYYPIAYPVYYYPYPVGYTFGVDYFWGVTSWFSVGWHTHHVHVLHHTDRLHPYYLNSYYFYTDYYPRTRVNLTVTVNNDINVWAPSTRRSGNRPRTVTTESRTSSVRTSRTTTVESQPRLSGSTTRANATTRSNAAVTNSTTSRNKNNTARAIESPPVTSSTRSVRTNEPGVTPSTRSSTSTRSQSQVITTQPSTRTRTPTVSQPSVSQRSSAQSSSRSTMTTQGSSTRRSTQSAAPPPVVSTPAPAPAPVTRSQSVDPGPRQAPADRGSSTRTRMR